MHSASLHLFIFQSNFTHRSSYRSQTRYHIKFQATIWSPAEAFELRDTRTRSRIRSVQLACRVARSACVSTLPILRSYMGTDASWGHTESQTVVERRPSYPRHLRLRPSGVPVRLEIFRPGVRRIFQGCLFLIYFCNALKSFKKAAHYQNKYCEGMGIVKLFFALMWNPNDILKYMYIFIFYSTSEH